MEEVGRDLGRLRVGVITTAFNGVDTHPDCVAATNHAADLCRQLGLEVEEAALEIPQSMRNALWSIVRPSTLVAVEERAAQLGREPTAEDVEPITWRMISSDSTQRGRLHPRHPRRSRDRADRRQLVPGLRHHADPDDGGAAVPAGASQPGPRRYGGTGPGRRLHRRLHLHLQRAGNPAASIPLYWNDDGLPIGAHFVAPYADEASLIRIGSALEQLQPWADRKPPVHFRRLTRPAFQSD